MPEIKPNAEQSITYLRFMIIKLLFLFHQSYNPIIISLYYSLATAGGLNNEVRKNNVRANQDCSII